MKSYVYAWKHMSKPAIVAALLLIAPTLLCYGRAARMNAEDQCKEILYGPGAADKQVGFVIQARRANPKWADPQSPDHAKAIEFVMNAFFDAKNQRGCQAIMLVSGDPSITLSAYKLLFKQLKNKTHNLHQSYSGPST